jgi:signal transduction histidine kinase
MGIGMYTASRIAFTRLEEMLRNDPPPHLELWTKRLTRYYVDTQSWDNVNEMIQSYPLGDDWQPWDESAWDMGVILAAADGTIVASPLEEHIGHKLANREKRWAIPIYHEQNPIGWLLFPSLDVRTGEFGPGQSWLFSNILQRFLLAEAIIILLTLLIGALLSRRMSTPLSKLAKAAHAIGAGDLSVRVAVEHHGEVRELEQAFNTMAEDLSHADDLRRNMTADIAHELRTPLSVIRGKLEGIVDGVYPATQQHLNPVLEETELLTHLVEDLRLLALAEAGQLPLEKRQLDIVDLLRDAQVNFTPQADDRGVSLRLDVPPELPKVAADWRRIAQILSNLLTNALRHTPQDGSVTLAVRLRDNQIEVSVRDTGTGIAEQDLPYVFERFWRRDKARTRSANGSSGLGLAIAKQLVEMHGGSIGVTSILDKGSTFWFTLPFA